MTITAQTKTGFVVGTERDRIEFIGGRLWRWTCPVCGRISVQNFDPAIYARCSQDRKGRHA